MINPTLAKAVGFVLTVVSMIFTTQLLTSFASNGFDELVYAAFGIGIQLTQTLMFLYCALHGKQLAAGLFLLLFGLSMVGSVGFFSVNDAKTLSLSNNSDKRFDMMQERTDTLSKQSAGIESQMAEYAKKRYFTNGVKPLQAQLSKLHDEQSQIHEAMVNFIPDPPGQALYAFLAKFFDMEVDQVKLYLFALYAFALDVSGVLLLSYSYGGGSGIGNPSRRRTVPVHEANNHQIAESMQVSKVSEADPVLGTVQAQPANPANPDKSMMLEYVKHLYPPTPKADGSLTGRRKVSDLIGISNKESDAVHRHLKSLGIISVTGSKTFPEMSKQEALQEVQK